MKWQGRIDEHLPAASGPVGFWAAVYARFARHRGSVLAGGLAFFALLSLVPSLLGLASLIVLTFDAETFIARLEEAFVDQTALVDQVAAYLLTLEESGTVTFGAIGVAGIVSIAISLYAASRFVYVGRQVLDIAFELDPEPPSFLSRGIAVLITFVCQVAIVVAILLLSLVPRVLDLLGIGSSVSQLIRYGRLPFALVVVYLLLTASMRFGTRARRVVGWANLGALVGTVTMLLGTLGLGWYLTVSVTYSQVVAVLGGVIALELWLYVIGLAIVISAEIEGVRHGFRRRDLGAPGVPRGVPTARGGRLGRPRASAPSAGPGAEPS